MCDLLKNNEKIMKYWNFNRNTELDLTCLTEKSCKNAWWICEKGHEWETTINHLYRGTRCPYCSGNKILKGYNDLMTTNSKDLKEWDYSKNEISPDEVSNGSRKKVWWVCPQGHSYLMPIVNKIKCGNSCPICSNRIVLEGYNDLKSKYPDIAKEWNCEKNGDLKPEDFVWGSNKKVWWICEKNHEWEATISSRTITGNGCRKCAIATVGNKIIAKNIEKKGNLLQTHPYLVKEWNYEKNGNLKPNDFHYGSTQKVWWICPQGHEYEQIIYARTKSNYNCPTCSNESHSSFPEQVVYYYCKFIFNKYNVINRYKMEKNEADIFIEGLNIAIEYDGYYYHNNDKTKQTEKKKNIFFKQNHIKLIRIKENVEDDIYNEDDDFDIISIKKDPDFNDINLMLEKLFKRIYYIRNIDMNCNIKFDVEKDKINIMDSYIYSIKTNSLFYKFPEISLQWNYKKNGKLTPEMFSYSSAKKVWWICEKGHEWEDSINNRVHGNGCLICSNRMVMLGVNDLKSKYPKIASEWNYEKNGGLKPENFVYGSTKNVWWICEKGHEYQCGINNRTSNNYQCPYCHNKILLCGFNDFKTKYPDIAQEWNYEKNGDLTPENIICNSSQKVWWICSSCNNEWNSSLKSRIIKNGGCPSCGLAKQLKTFAKNQVSKKGSLLQNNPTLAKEWNYEKNGDLKPEDFVCGSNKKVWWICEKKHEWQAAISKRNNGTKCPYCSNMKVLIGYNDFESQRPEKLVFWDYKKNNILPEKIYYKSYSNINWKCPKCKFEWVSKVVTISEGKGCPNCKFKN